jgi:cyanophycinase-like exopeptidase
MGRAMAFVARLLRDGITDRALAIGIDEGTSLAIDRQGIAQVMTDDEEGSAYFILGNHQPEVCEPETPLSFSDYRIWRVRDSETFDLQNIPTTGYYQVSVERGGMSPANPYRG